ncbi:MAG: carbohydrate binding domain-containing protein, partial [candidate division WOR-3 bacterium]
MLKKNASAVARWLKAGGHLLAIELDAEEANMFLPAPIKTTKQEHIAAYFEPLGVSSLFAGVSPADVHNRDPRELPLVSGGAKVIDNGVLAQTGNIVFCQLAPYRFVKAPEDAPAFAVTAEEAVEGKQSALLTMGTVPWGQFGQKVQAGEVGKTYTFTVFVKALGKPVRVRLEVERAGRPWDRAVRSEDTEVPADKWTELHVTFKVEKPYPEGWQAYLHCGQPYARLRADLFQLYEGTYVPGQVDSGIASTTQGGKNFFANPSFETGMQPWFFSWQTEQHNLRKTYRRTSFLLTRLLANMGVRGETPLLSRFSTPVRSSSRESVVKNGDFRLDSDNNGMPDYWEFSTDNKQATCILEEMAPGAPQRCLRITCPEFGER